MSHVPHEIADEFPEHKEKIHALKTADAHFARLIDEYHHLNREIHRVETGVAPASDDHEKHLRRQRLTLLDQIAARLSAA